MLSQDASLLLGNITKGMQNEVENQCIYMWTEEQIFGPPSEEWDSKTRGWYGINVLQKREYWI